MKNAQVQAAISTQQAQQLEAVEVRIEDVLRDLKAIAHTDPHVLSEQSGVPARWADKLKALELAPGESLSVHKKISVNDMSTRKHYAGRPAVDAILNGEIMPLGFFSLLDRQEEPED